MGIVLVEKRWEYRVNCEGIRKVCKSVFPASTQNIPQRLMLASGKTISQHTHTGSQCNFYSYAAMFWAE